MKRLARKIYEPSVYEKDIAEFWSKENIYDRSKEVRAKGKDLYFLDSPHVPSEIESPDILGSMILKDAIIRYLRMRGYNVRDRAGFEGFVTEAESRALQDMGIEREEIDEVGWEKYLNSCRKEAKDIRDEIAEFFKSFGVWLEWRHTYTPLDNRYMEGVWYAFKKLNEKGLVDRFRSVSLWCPKCHRFVSRNEIRSEMEWKRGIYVKFPLKGKNKAYLIVWFSEPWMLVATLSLEIIPSKTYSIIMLKTTGDRIIIGKDEAEEVLKNSGISKYEIKGEISGKELVGRKYSHPLFGMETEEGIIGIDEIESEELRIDRIVAGRSGGMTGMKPVVPAHSLHGLSLAEKEDIPVMSPISESGELGRDTGKYAGFDVFEAESIILRDLVNMGMALSTYDIRENVRYCASCGSRVIPKVSEEWSFKPSDTADKSSELASEIEWHPSWMMGIDYEWMHESLPVPISAKGYWGVPMPVWICEKCGHREIIGSAKELEEKSHNFKSGMGLQRPWIDRYPMKCPECGGDMKRVEEILTPDFVDAAASWAQLHYPASEGEFRRWWPADMLVEPLKKARGWIYLQMAVSGAVFNSRPFKSVIGKGKIDISSVGKKPEDIIKKFDIDSFRYALLRQGLPWTPKKLRNEWFQRIAIIRNRIWNMGRFASIYYRISEFKADVTGIELIHEYGLPIDKWLISILEGLKERYISYMDRYMPNEALKEVEKVSELISKWYIKAIKSRIKSADIDRREVLVAYRAMHEAIIILSKLLAPFLPYFSEAVYREIGGKEKSVHMESIESPNKLLVDRYLEVRMDIAMDIIRSGRKARRKAGMGIRWPLDRIVVKAISREVVEATELFGDFIREQLNVRRIETVPPTEEWEEMILEVIPNPNAIGMVYRQWSSRIAVMLKNRPAKKIREGIEKGEYYLGIEGQLVKILPNMVKFVSKLPDYVVEESFLDGKVYLDVRSTDDMLIEGRVRELIRRVQDMRKDMGLNFTDYINLYIAGNEEIESAVESWGEEIAEATRSQEIALTNEEGMEGEYIVEWYIEGEKVIIGITPLYWEEMIEAFSRIPGVTKARAESLFEAGYTNFDDLLRSGADEIAQIPGVGPSLAKKISAYMKQEYSEGAELIPVGGEYICSACGNIMEEPEEVCPKCHLPLHLKKEEKPQEMEEIEEETEEKMEEEIEEFVETVGKIKGIGPSKARALYKAGFHSIEDLKKASAEDIAKVPKMSKTIAEFLLSQLGVAAEKREISEKGEAKEEKEKEMSEDEFIKELTKLKGIGPSKARALYKSGFHSIKSLRKASIEDIAKVPRFSRALAESIKEAYTEIEGEIEEEKEESEKEKKVEWSPGKLYIFANPDEMYRLAKDYEKKKSILYLTKNPVNSLKEKYGLKAKSAFQISDIARKALRPNELDRIALKIQKFSSKSGEKMVVMDAFDQLVSNNSFESVINFIDAMKEDFSAKDCMLMLSVNLNSLDEDERKQIEDKADEII